MVEVVLWALVQLPSGPIRQTTMELTRLRSSTLDFKKLNQSGTFASMGLKRHVVDIFDLCGLSAALDEEGVLVALGVLSASRKSVEGRVSLRSIFESLDRVGQGHAPTSKHVLSSTDTLMSQFSGCDFLEVVRRISFHCLPLFSVCVAFCWDCGRLEELSSVQSQLLILHIFNE